MASTEALVSIRDFAPEDQNRAVEIWKAGLFGIEEEGSAVLWKFMDKYFQSVVQEGCMKDIHSHYGDPGRRFFVAEHQGDVIGIVGAVPFDDNGNAIELERFAVAPEARRKGVGGLLVGAVLEFARSRGATSVKLSTRRDKNKAATRLYEKHGFQVVKQSKLSKEDILEYLGIESDEIIEDDYFLTYELRLDGTHVGYEQPVVSSK